MQTAIRRPLLAVVAVLCAGLLSGCGEWVWRGNGLSSVPVTTVSPVATSFPVVSAGPACYGAACSPRTLVATPAKLTAVGYGSAGAYNQYTAAQQKLMAMRAAQMDAYRNLAEQVNGFRIWGNTAVSAFATQNDSIRSYVDAYIRGARVVSVTSIADGNFEATVELDVSQQFIDCFGAQGNCGFRTALPACTTTGCGLPSVVYMSN